MRKNEEIKRCGWCGDDTLYKEYHDQEWGKPIYDDHKLFELLILESAQAGLSWITILRRRENYRKAFDNFFPQKIANYSEEKIQALRQDESIIRHEGKIRAAVQNAQVFLAIQKEFGTFYTYLYSFLPNKKPMINQFQSLTEVPSQTTISKALSLDLKKRGMRFFGPTICYAYMQATGMVNDHIISCDFR